MQILTTFGLAGPRGMLASNTTEAVAIAKEVGFPVVCKIVSPDISHKTDIGGVEIGLESPDEVRHAYQRIMDGARRHVPTAEIKGILVQEQIPSGVEILVGAIVDDGFGPFVVVGLGGVFAEALDDIMIRPAPLSEQDVYEMLRDLRGSKLIDGFRGSATPDIAALADSVVRLSHLVNDHADVIDTIDLNPVVVLPEGQGVRVLDALIVGRAEPDRIPPQA